MLSNFFIAIYNFLEQRRPFMYSVLVLLFSVMIFLSLRVNFTEDITSFFPEKNKNAAIVFDNLKMKDKIIVIISDNGSDSETDSDDLVEAVGLVEDRLYKHIDSSLVTEIVAEVDEAEIDAVKDFVYANLPIFITESEYGKLDSLTSATSIDVLMESNYNKLLSPAGSFMQEYIFTDPLWISGATLANLESLNNGTYYQVYNNRIFNSDMNMAMLFISPKYSLGNTNQNSKLIKQIEDAIEECSNAEELSAVDMEYFGGASVAVYNAKQIKFDTIVTLNIAILIVIVLVALAFKNRWAVLLITLPVLFGALFSLSWIYIIKGSISAIAVGCGAVVFGIALSYSIHILSHSNHESDKRQIIKDLVSPLVIGSFTTIGAFIGMLFTSSPLLRDFGLFSALTLIGTTLFSLIFLPHFLRTRAALNESSPMLRFIEKISSYQYHKNKVLVACVFIVTIASLFVYNKVSFNSDMMELNYEPEHLKEAEAKLIANSDDGMVLFVAADQNRESAIDAYHDLSRTLEKYCEDGKIEHVSTIKDFIVSDSIQRLRLAKWRRFWTDDRVERTMERIESSASRYGIKQTAFGEFRKLITSDYKELDYSSDNSSMLSDWIDGNDSISIFIAYAPIADSVKAELYSELSENSSIMAADRAYYVNNMAEEVNRDFYLMLFVSSFIVFFTLLVSYGRLELALMAFMPMVISWVIILGMMYLFGIEFNIVNIILSTFIFGIGDDFSIFIMDGMLHEYRTGKKMLVYHKTAILFTAITTIIGMGSLLFAGHPALKSISVISTLGMVAVLIVSYTIQPLIFRLIVPKSTAKGGLTNTIMSFLNSCYAFGLFVSGCLLLKAYYYILCISVPRSKIKVLYSVAISRWTKWFMDVMITTRVVKLNPSKESFKNPAVIISNHQSFIDILILVGLNPKFVMVTNHWVWNSPFFGRIVRSAGFCNISNGYDSLALSLKEKVKQGYSIIVFPEGTRSKDQKIGRFHKGAFYLAEALKLDIVPIILYGNGMVCSTTQTFYIKKGFVVSKVMPRILYDDTRYGETYQQKWRGITRYFKEEYAAVVDHYNRSFNPYFYDALIKSYIYKGPVLEWYMRVKIKMENCYDRFDRILPRNGYIIDVGCGYGPLSYMLSQLSPERRVLGLDYDSEKIEVCQNSILKRDNINFEIADVCNYKFPSADAFVINDVLHYMDYDSQNRLIKEVLASVNIGGVVVIRDGNSEDVERHKRTLNSERWSTKILKFNKVKQELCFTSTTRIKDVISEFDVSLEIIRNDDKTSNTIYVIRRNA